VTLSLWPVAVSDEPHISLFKGPLIDSLVLQQASLWIAGHTAT